MEDTTTAPVAEPEKEATTSAELGLDERLDSIFASSDEENESTPTTDDEPDEPQSEEVIEPESQESEEEEEEAEEETEEKPEETKTGVDKRISQLVAQKNKLRDKLESAEERLAALEAGKSKTSEPAKSPWENELSDIRDPAELQKKVDSAHQMKDWALRNLDGGEVPGEDGETQYVEAEQVRTALANAEKVLREAPRQSQVLEFRSGSLAEAHDSYPWLNDPESEHFKVLQQEVAIWGDFKVRDLPNLELIFANALMGEHARQKKKGGKAAKPKAPEKAPEVPTGKAQPRQKQKSSSKVKQNYLETGDDAALDNLLDEFIT